MALQNTVQEYQGEAFPGMWWDLTDTEAFSRLVKLTPMAFGIAAVRGDNQHVCRVPDDADELATGTATTVADNPFLGIVMYHAAPPRQDGRRLSLPMGDGDGGFLMPTEAASLATQGRICVVTETDAQYGQPVFYRHTCTDPTTQQLGALRSDEDGGNAREIKGAIWHRDNDAGTLCVAQLGIVPNG